MKKLINYTGDGIGWHLSVLISSNSYIKENENSFVINTEEVK